ncbi:MAG: alanine--tRNA ligase [Nitrospirae bacterium]|nr:alanine--tRNA ligase [Candidatus Manganitrophaceae bacterium]
MTASEVRSLFVQYFADRNHEIIPSASLIPEGDPTLLFNNAGMVQFKNTFLGEEPRSYLRAVSSQKCVRAGGKHNDLENVGRTARHHTFFEMLGNFSFGDYFKADAIHFSWELLTKTFKLSPSKLWITIFRDDDEAAELWQKIVPAERIIRLGEKDNFWQMGDIGPCGPCSEIMFDQGEVVHADCPGIGVCECDRYLEIWNLVFMQYNRDVEGKLTPLPQPSIDTGMGLERMTAVCQGVLSNYEIDLFKPIFEAIAKRAARPFDEVAASVPGKVIADHLRALTFMAADGVMPSNEGRGYVFRRILRRAARFGRKFGFDEPFLHVLIDAVVSEMSDAYPNLIQQKTLIQKLVLGEEERFIHTLNHGMHLLEGVIEALKKKEESLIPGESLFTLYDTYGFPVNLTEEVAAESGMTLDLQGYEHAMSAQKERARQSWVGGVQLISKNKNLPFYKDLLARLGKTFFSGYTCLQEDIQLKAIFQEGKLQDSAQEGDEVTLVFDRSPFYAESGGQVGDKGSLFSETSRAVIEQTSSPLPGLILHHVKVTQGRLKTDGRYTAAVDPTLRRNTAKNHTGTHLLHSALRAVLGDHVKQAGSLVSPTRLRFDFQHFSPLTQGEIDRIEADVNTQIMCGESVQTQIMDMKTAVNSGAMALFGEKYGDEVRVVSVGNYSRELCGGTHCQNVGEIGFFKIIKEGSVASGVRRLEALTGPSAYEYTKNQEKIILDISRLLKVNAEDILHKSERLMQALKEKDQEILRLRRQQQSETDPLSNIQHIGTVKVLLEKLLPSEMKEIRSRADHLRDLLKSGIIIVGAESPDGKKVSLVVMVTSDCTAQYKAGDIAKKLAVLIDGSGGGKPEMAQAGGKRVENLDRLFEEAITVIGRS